MHATMFQIVSDKDNALDINSAAEIVTNFVDYIDEMDEGFEADEIERQLKKFQANGCEVDFEERKFKIVDKEKLLGALLNFKLPEGINTYEEVFKYLNDTTQFDVLIIDGSVYRSLRNAFANELFDYDNSYIGDEKTFYITNAWDYHI